MEVTFMKRNRKILICMTDDEYAALDRLVETYSVDSRVSKSFLVRYALKRLPHQPIIPGVNFC